jgi:D-glycero-alpha-D-manno-heptose 1-phosphate guanylyltransferase
MEAIVLAGGFGTRLRSVVPDLPKPMAPIGGRPFLEILLASLAEKGFRHIVLSLGYQADVIQKHFSHSFAGMHITYSIESSPLGTGGAVRTALELCRNDHVFILNGDTYLDFEAADIEALWHENHHPIIVARFVTDTSRFGKLAITAGHVDAFLEKNEVGAGYINAGCYVLPSRSLDTFRAGSTFSLERDFLSQAVNERSFDAFITNGLFIDIGVPDDYALAQTLLSGTVA